MTNSNREKTIGRRRRRSPMMMKPKPSLLFYIWIFTHTLTATKRMVNPQHIRTGSVEAKKPIPQSRAQSFLYSTSPPWNPSPQIDEQGFLSSKYLCVPGSWEKEARIGGKYGFRSKHTRKLAAEEQEMRIRQVPGDGNCLFHSLAAALSWVEDGVHLQFDENCSNPNHPRSLINLGWQKQKGSLDAREMKRLGFDENATYKRKKRRRLNGQHLDLDEGADIYTRSAILRQLSVDMFLPSSLLKPNAREMSNKYNDQQNDNQKGTRRKERQLFLQGSEFLKPKELLQVASSQYGMSGEEYCEQMRNDGVWGGGPEIVGLCNWLRRPIHVYELISVKPKIKKSNGLIRILKTRQMMHHKERNELKENEDEDENYHVEPEFRLRRMACFGSPKFDDREPLHILSADCRFPDITPGQQASAGNHFMAVFPTEKPRAYHVRQRRMKRQKSAIDSVRSNVRVRSGGGEDINTLKHEKGKRKRRKDKDKASQTRKIEKRIEHESTLIGRIIDFATRRSKISNEPEVMSSNPIKTLKKWYCGQQKET